MLLETRAFTKCIGEKEIEKKINRDREGQFNSLVALVI